MKVGVWIIVSLLVSVGVFTVMACGDKRPNPTPTSTCDGSSCAQEPTCDQGTHACGTACVANQSVESCGTRCTPCESPGATSANCVNESCVFSCKGRLKCDGACCAAAILRTWGASSCAKDERDELVCWGLNSSGQLGDGTSEDQHSPVRLATFGPTIGEFAVGGAHVCATKRGEGALYCWGQNIFGQLGIGSKSASSAPSLVVGLSPEVSRISLGTLHSCAITNGAVSCWGSNMFGALGDGSGEDRTTAVGVEGLSSGAEEISAGGGHTCALIEGGGIKCWGYNVHGQLGDGTTDGAAAPVDVPAFGEGKIQAVAVASGRNHTCALTSEGGVKCWGWSFNGRLGNANVADINITQPIDVVGLQSGVASLASGGRHSCAITSAGAILCWGNNQKGQIGDGSGVDRAVPTQVRGLSSGVKGMALGVDHACALLENGSIWCWGDNSLGSLGDGTTNSLGVPVEVVMP